MGEAIMPKISITISDYTYWKLLGSGESVSTIIQKALKDYWKENQKKISETTLLQPEK
jgi:hypothetical protein